MSMKIEVKENYPTDVKRYVEDYNKGVEAQDIMEVSIAVDGLLQLVFHADKNIRDFANVVLYNIGQIQPGFLKKGVPVLLHRYKGTDKEKSEFASVLLGLLTETPAKQLITDAEALKLITQEHIERVSKQKIEDDRKKEFLQKTQQKEINFMGITGEFLQIGQFYNKLIVDENFQDAQKLLEQLIQRTLEAYGVEGKQEEYDMGCTLFSILCNKENREPVVLEIVKKFLTQFEDSKKKQKEAYQEFIISTIKAIQDLVPPKYAAEFVSTANKRMEEKKKEGFEKIKQLQQIQRQSININVVWETSVKNLASAFNESLKNNDEKTLNKIFESLKPFLFSKDPSLIKSSSEFFSQMLEKNYALVEDFISKLAKDYKKPDAALILGENIEILEQKHLIDKGIKNFLVQDKAQREAKEREEKEKVRKELEKIEKLKIEFSADWDKRLLQLIEEINSNFIANKVKDAEKLVLGSMKNYIYAENKEISKQAIEFLNNVAKKYPDIIIKIMKELFDLFKSEHERRFIAVDLLGLLSENPNKEKLFKGVPPEIVAKIKEDNAKRAEDIQKAQLEDKWDAIKLDVTTIVIDLNAEKKLQKVCRDYNEAIKAKNKKEVIENVQIIVDWFLNEKTEEKLNQIIEVIGKIAKQNIELIAPAIEMFIKMVDSKDEDTKFRAIKGLGEVSFQRPGWAYQGLEKLVAIAESDQNENARMKALVELSRVGKANPTMLIEHISMLIKALKDSNKHVRRLAAWTIGSMAEAIPLEAEEAIPALVDALHDEYHLVRQFADKALKLIRAAMRK